MIITRLKQLAKTYRKRGIVYPSDLLLELKDALELLDELAAVEVLVTGVDGWICLNREKGQAVQGPGVGFSVEEHIPYLEMTPKPSVKLIKEYINEQLPPDYDLVSISFDDPKIWDLFTGEGNVG